MAQQAQNEEWRRISVREASIIRAEKLLRKNKSFGTVGGLLNHLIHKGLEEMEEKP